MRNYQASGVIVSVKGSLTRLNQCKLKIVKFNKGGNVVPLRLGSILKIGLLKGNLSHDSAESDVVPFERFPLKGLSHEN